MIILNDSLLLNGTNLTTNGSINLTINLTTNLIAENLTGHLVSSPLSQIIPVITLIIGSLLTYFINILNNNRKEEKEVQRYEYTLITDILEIANGEDTQNQMTEYYGKEKRNFNFIKMKNYKFIMEFMKNTIDGRTSDIEGLKAIRDELKTQI